MDPNSYTPYINFVIEFKDWILFLSILDYVIFFIASL